MKFLKAETEFFSSPFSAQGGCQENVCGSETLVFPEELSPNAHTRPLVTADAMTKTS